MSGQYVVCVALPKTENILHIQTSTMGNTFTRVDWSSVQRVLAWQQEALDSFLSSTQTQRGSIYL